jgi:hypothetical protein
MHAVTNTTMNVLYYGNQNISTAGTLTNKLNKVQPSGLSAGAIAGAVIGSVLGCCLLIVVASIIILVVTWTNRSVIAKNIYQDSYELSNSDTLQSDQKPPVTSDIEQPIEQNVEQVFEIPSDNQGMTVELTSQDDKEPLISEDNQDQIDSPVVTKVEENKDETAMEEVLVDLSNNDLTLHVEMQNISTDNNTE